MTGRHRPESFAGDANDGASAGTDSGDEDEPNPTNGSCGRPEAGVPGSGEPGSDEDDEIDDSDHETDAQMNQESDQAQLVGGNKKGPEAPGSPNIRSSKKNSKATKSR